MLQLDADRLYAAAEPDFNRYEQIRELIDECIDLSLNYRQSGRGPHPGRDRALRRRAPRPPPPIARPARQRLTVPGKPEAQLAQLLGASAACFCSTSSPSMEIWISSLTTNRPSSIMLKLSPKSLRLIWPVAP